MALYYFHTTGAHAYVDEVGTDIGDRSTVRAAAIKATAEVMADQSEDWTGSAWGMQVMDEAGMLILTIDFAIREPAVPRSWQS